MKKGLSNYYIYILFITAALIILIFCNYAVAIIGFLLEILLILYLKRNKENSYDVKEFCEIFLKKFPIAAAFIDNDRLVWHNDIYNNYIELLDINDIKNKYLNNSDNFIIETKGHKFEVKVNKINLRNECYFLFFVDKNDTLKKSEQLIGDSKNINQIPVIGILQIDNYDEFMQGADELKKPLLIAEIENNLNVWADKIDTCIRKYENDSYIMFLTDNALKKAEEEKFSILEDVKNVISENKILVTLSIGIALFNESIRKTYQDAYTALDLALGRGGDQAVVKKGEKLTYYGGKTQAVEKQTRVRARVIAHALGRLIEDSSNIIIIGHKFADMDSIGSSFGIFRACRKFGKVGYIVIDTINVTAKTLVEEFENSKDCTKYIVTPLSIMPLVNENSLVVIVDTQSTDYMECPEILNIANRIVIIDHHRKNNNSVEKPMLSYLEPYASSTCELVTELLQYMVREIKLTKLEAEALLAGIMLDTKYFTYRTGVRTFEAASYLKRMGADTTNIKRLFKYDLSSYVQKANIISSSTIIKGGIAIAICPSDYDNPQLLIAQCADELLNVNGVEASFVMTEINGSTYISGRSTGKINVQLILEKLGGGGHLGVAGAKIEDNINESKKMLLDEINKYFEEEKS